MGMAALILLIACSNVASLLIARAMARQKEISVRLAIGASRGTLIGQLLVESFLLALTGATLGLLLSMVATQALLAMLPSSGALLMLHAEPDRRILLFGIAASLVTGLLFGLVPAIQATGVDLLTTLKDEGGGVAGVMRSTRLRKTLVVSQVTLSFLLLVGAGLFARTLVNLKHTETGFHSIENLVTFGLNPAKNGYSVPSSVASTTTCFARFGRRLASKRPPIRGFRSCRAGRPAGTHALKGMRRGTARPWKSRTTSSHQGTGRQRVCGCSRGGTSMGVTRSIRRRAKRSQLLRSSIEASLNDSSEDTMRSAGASASASTRTSWACGS